MKETLVRSLTGIVFISVVILSLISHSYLYLLLFSTVLFLAWLEFVRISKKKIPGRLGIPGATILVLMFLGVFLLATGQLPENWILIPGMAPFLFLLLYAIFRDQRSSYNLPYTLGGFLFLLAGFSALNLLVATGESGYSPRWVIFTLCFLWTNDTMAYVSGRLFGKHRIWPSLSPGKTWEGSIGGALFTLLLGWIFSRYYVELAAWEWMVFALIVVVFGSLGDFLESWVKRTAEVKDSGNILPGHGGILDRFDSFLFAVPAVTVYIYILG
jgi:phosphatidate cytidylyltransferase